MTLDLFTKGMFVSTSQPASGTSLSYNFNVPTNPVMTTIGTSFTSGDVLFSAIYPDDSEETVYSEVISNATLQAEYENLSVTKGYNLHCFDVASSVGISLATIDAATTSPNVNTHHYFVLIYSDNHLLHHFAKITEIKNSDTLGDSFDFEPKLGNEIPQGTKFKLYKGPAIASKAIAFSAGIKQDLKTNLQVARPHFWFNNEVLDNKNELDHNTKYFARIDGEGDGSSITLNTAANRVTFLTAEDYSNKIVDYSKYSLQTKQNDTLRNLDLLFHRFGGTFTATKVAGSNILTITNNSADARLMPFNLILRGTGMVTGNSGTLSNTFSSLNASEDADKIIMGLAAHSSGTITVTMKNNEFIAVGNDGSNYDASIEHAKREETDLINKTDLSGPIRYLHYDYSPTKNNTLENVIDLELEESLGKKSSYSDIVVADSFRIMSKKVNNYDALRVRQEIHRGDFNDWISFGATITSVTSNVSNKPLYAITTPVDLTTYLNDGDEVLINSRVMIVFDVTASTLRFYQESRLETDSVFTTTTSIATISANTEIYRRAWNKTDGTLLTGMKMIDDRQDDLYVSLISNEFSSLEADITSYISQTGLLYLSFANQGYDNTSSLDKMKGQYTVYNEKLNGRITKLSQDKPDGQTIMTISGADKLRELLDPIIEKNTLFSKDIVYSTDSFYNKVTALGVNATTTFETNILDTSGGSHTAGVGDKIFAQSVSGVMLYLGQIKTSNSVQEFVFETNNKTQVTNRPAFKAATKYTVFNKALSSNSLVSSSTSLYGSANKGIAFESGVTLVSGSEIDNLAGSSITTTDANAIGYYLSEAKNMKSDNLFQARLDDNASSKSYATFDTVNTLIDFNILSIKSNNGNQIIEIAPHIPLTLGRVDINYGNTQDTTFLSVGTSTAAITSTTQRFITSSPQGSTPHGAAQLLSGVTTLHPPRNYHGSPLYINGVFGGFITLVTLENNLSDINDGSVDIYIYVDRPLPVTSSGATLSTITGDSTYNETGKLQHELSLLNGGHLHGGKVITLLNPTREAVDTADGVTAVLDFPLYYSGGTFATTNSERHGMPYYRITNMEKGNITKNKIIYTDPIDKNYSYYEEKLSKIPYYASAYKFDPAFHISGGLQNNITGVGKVDNVARLHTPIESRNGSIPPSGSNFFDSVIHNTNSTYERIPIYVNPLTDLNSTATDHSKTPFAVKDTLWQPDPKVARMFLFINSDLRPYSSTRKDSLLNTASRDITKYNLFALTDGNIEEHSHVKDANNITTKTINYKDSNYSSSNIVSSERTLSDLNRFGMMRLTELCFDWAFNQFDPENPPDKDKTLPKLNYYHHTILSLDRTINSVNAKVLTMNSGGFSVGDGDLLIDAEGRYIGIVDGAVSSGTGITLHAVPYHTNGFTLDSGGNGVALNTTSVIYKVTSTTESEITGHGTKDSFVELYEDIHMLKTAVVNTVEDGANASTVGYSKSGESWHDRYGSTIGDENSHSTRNPNLFSPVNFGGILGDYRQTHTTHPSLFLKMFDTIDNVYETDVASDATDDATYNKWFLPIFLDRFSIEDGSSLAQSGMVGAHINNASRVFDNTGNTDSDGNETQSRLLGYALNSKFSNKENMGSDGNITYSRTADGVFLAFKPRLRIGLTSADGNFMGPFHTTAKGSVYVYTFQARGQHTWLKFTNLTGTYLASEAGKYTTVDGGIDFITSNTQGLDEVTPNTLSYVISHEIDDNSTFTDATCDYANSNTTVTHNTNKRIVAGLTVTGTGIPSGTTISSITNNGAFVLSQAPTGLGASVTNGTLTFINSVETHILTLDRLAAAVETFRILQPNHTCTYSYSPKEIELNTLSSKYTKMPYTNSMYKGINNYGLKNARGDRTLQGDNEGILSMYVLVDTEHTSSSGSNSSETVVSVNNVNTMLSGTSGRYCISDGDTMFSTELAYIKKGTGTNGNFIKLDNMKETLGVVSISEITSITVSGSNIQTNSKRAMIGSVVNICGESEDIIEELLQEQGTSFAITKEDYPLFLSPNFNGVTLFEAINFLLIKKNKKLIQTKDSFSIKNKKDNSFYSNLLISDNGDIRIFNYEVIQSTFEEYNEIIVHGKSHKTKQRDGRSIKRIGKKSLKVFDRRLTTKTDVDNKAKELRRIHVNPANRLKVTVGHNNISQLRVGDLVNVEIKQENIPLNQYLVLQITHALGGLMELELGKYVNKMEDRFSELKITMDGVQTEQNVDSEEDTNKILMFENTIKIKPLRLLVRKRTTSGAMTLGFSTPLNTGTAQLGFTGGATVVYTTIKEEEF